MQIVNRLAIFFMVGLLLVASGCSKDEPSSSVPTPNSTDPLADTYSRFDVYFAGGTSGDSAVLWKNGVAKILSGKKAFAYSVYVSGADVYVAGVANDSAVFWKNGIQTNLSAGATATSIFVSGSDVYVGGTIAFSAAIWKNGVPVIYGADGLIRSVWVSGQDVYATSNTYLGLSKPTLWKNGVATSLTPAAGTLPVNAPVSAANVMVSGTDVFVCGRFASTSVVASGDAFGYWKNNVVTLLSGPGDKFFTSTNTSVFVSGSDVYLSGYAYQVTNGDARALLWKNGKCTDISGGAYTTALRVMVLGSDVFVLGTGAPGTHVTWRNGSKLVTENGVVNDGFVVIK